MSRRGGSMYRMESIYTEASIGDGRRAGPPPGLINALLLGIFYGYFAMHIDGDADTCFANDSDDSRLKDDASVDAAKSYTDIGQRYHFSFAALFFMTIIQATIAFFAYSIGRSSVHEAAEPVYKLAIFFYAMASLLEFCIWIWLIFTRFTHEGRVCSGDFLSNRTPPLGYCPQ